MLRIRHIGLGIAVGLTWMAGNNAAFAAKSDYKSVHTEAVVQALSRSRHVPSEILIQYRASGSASARSQVLERTRAREKETMLSERHRRDGKGDLVLATLPPDFDIADAVRALEADPAVEYAEPNWVYQHQDVSNDAYYTSGKLWGMYGDSTYPANAYGSQAGEAWNAGRTGSNTVYIGVIDEGVMHNHQDLAANMWVNPYETADGLDNDGNGYIDDVRGWDFNGNNNTTYDGAADDHGSHVAGTLGAVGGNAAGVAGMVWNVKIISAKFLGSRGGTLANAIRAIDYLTDLKARHGLNIVATNNSWGGGGYSQLLLDAINRGGDAGILFVAAAGNGGADLKSDNNDVVANYPSNYVCKTPTRNWNCVIAVAALTNTGALASFSNYGVNTVDLAAPGVSIYSTVPGRKNSSSYGAMSGTSMATPHVTGAVGLYAAMHPDATPEQIRAAILAATIPTPALAGKTVTGGRLNVSGF